MSKTNRTMRDSRPAIPDPIVITEEQVGIEKKEEEDVEVLLSKAYKQMEAELLELNKLIPEAAAVLTKMESRKRLLVVRMQSIIGIDPDDDDDDDPADAPKEDEEEEEDETDTIVTTLRANLPTIKEGALSVKDCCRLVHEVTNGYYYWTMRQVHYALKVGYHEGYFVKRGSKWYSVVVPLPPRKLKKSKKS